MLRDLDTGLVVAAGISPANAPEASVTGGITADLEAAGLTLAGLHIDRAYLSSELVRDRGPDLAIFCKAWRSATPAAGSPRTSSASTLPPAADLPRWGSRAL